MASSVPLTLDLDADVLRLLEAAAAWRSMSVEEFALSAVATAAKMDVELAAFVQEGIDSADRGDTFSQEEMEEWFEARYRPAAAE